MCRYATDGALPMDNNPVENAIRPVCLGKKNWLFLGSERAGPAFTGTLASLPVLPLIATLAAIFANELRHHTPLVGAECL